MSKSRTTSSDVLDSVEQLRKDIKSIGPTTISNCNFTIEAISSEAIIAIATAAKHQAIANKMNAKANRENSRALLELAKNINNKNVTAIKISGTGEI
jgi:hypothetical protein